MATTGKKAGGDTLPVRVYIQPTAGTDGQLLHRAIQGATSQSGLLQMLIMRGWLNLLHGIPADERSLQLRAMGLPDDLIAEIDAMKAKPQFLTLRERDAQTPAPSVQATPAAAPVEAPAPPVASPPPPVAPPAPAQPPKPPAFVAPVNSRLGSIGEQGGLA